MNGYKVVYNHNEELISSSHFYAEDDIKKGIKIHSVIVYKKDEWSEKWPIFGPLCVFDNFLDASKFCSDWRDEDFELWECEYELSNDNHVWSFDVDEKMIYINMADLPDGTVLADKVKLIKRI